MAARAEDFTGELTSSEDIGRKGPHRELKFSSATVPLREAQASIRKKTTECGQLRWNKCGIPMRLDPSS